MKPPHVGKILVTGLFLHVLFSNARADSENRPIGAMETTHSSEDCEEREEAFVTAMQDNYIDAFNQMLDFFMSIKPDLTEIKQRLDRLEKLTIFIPTDISSMKSIFTWDKFRRSLPLPMNGNSFGGSTFEQIAAALPSNSLAVKFVNYMETDLKECQLDLHYGSAQINPPTNDFSRTTQVATITPHPDGDDGIAAHIPEDPLNPLKSIDVKQM
ncbi:unnamed protein product [Allacma fusca]|uniref:Uncharacterized protein n=1 Tax=Allacma fusca TaxID=39272 RepID=A0A8J2LL13_9HEXA|nr:unnamed protein product [Allacma fusca]